MQAHKYIVTMIYFFHLVEKHRSTDSAAQVGDTIAVVREYALRRVDKVLSFLSSRPNWDSPTPSHAGECVP
jgi:hypothetical protein